MDLYSVFIKFQKFNLREEYVKRGFLKFVEQEFYIRNCFIIYY